MPLESLEDLGKWRKLGWWIWMDLGDLSQRNQRVWLDDFERSQNCKVHKEVKSCFWFLLAISPEGGNKPSIMASKGWQFYSDQTTHPYPKSWFLVQESPPNTLDILALRWWANLPMRCHPPFHSRGRLSSPLANGRRSRPCEHKWSGVWKFEHRCSMYGTWWI